MKVPSDLEIQSMKESPFVDDPVARPKSETTGILPFQAIQGLIDGGSIIAPKLDGDQIQPASLDLRLGKKAFQIGASFLPGHSPIEGKIRDLLIQGNRAQRTPQFWSHAPSFWFLSLKV